MLTQAIQTAHWNAYDRNLRKYLSKVRYQSDKIKPQPMYTGFCKRPLIHKWLQATIICEVKQHWTRHRFAYVFFSWVTRPQFLCLCTLNVFWCLNDHWIKWHFMAYTMHVTAMQTECMALNKRCKSFRPTKQAVSRKMADCICSIHTFSCMEECHDMRGHLAWNSK